MQKGASIAHICEFQIILHAQQMSLICWAECETKPYEWDGKEANFINTSFNTLTLSTPPVFFFCDDFNFRDSLWHWPRHLTRISCFEILTFQKALEICLVLQIKFILFSRCNMAKCPAGMDFDFIRPDQPSKCTWTKDADPSASPHTKRTV